MTQSAEGMSPRCPRHALFSVHVGDIAHRHPRHLRSCVFIYCFCALLAIVTAVCRSVIVEITVDSLFIAILRFLVTFFFGVLVFLGPCRYALCSQRVYGVRATICDLVAMFFGLQVSAVAVSTAATTAKPRVSSLIKCFYQLQSVCTSINRCRHPIKHTLSTLPTHPN